MPDQTFTAGVGSPTFVPEGGWVGVRNTSDPGDDNPRQLVSVTNGYFPDPAQGSGIYGRPGFTAANAVAVSTGQCQGVFTMTTSDGTVYNFLFMNGKVYRQNTNLTSAPTDVTPTNVWIATGTSTSPVNVTSGRMIFCTALNDSLIVNDGVNPPWVGTNLGSTPITATMIDYLTPAINLSMGTVSNLKVKNAALPYAIFANGSTVAATLASAETALAAGTIPTNTWGIYRFEVASGGAISSTAGAANFTTGYGTEALAIAALPARTMTKWDMGYVTILTKAATTFVGGTDALQGGVGGNVATTTNYYAGLSSPWVAFGQPVVWDAALVFILRSVGVTSSPTTFAWSEPNQPNVGYQQTNYADWWTYIQTSQQPLYCAVATNDALYLSRAYSWSAIYGAPGIGLSSTATDALVSENIGCVAPATVKKFGNYIYFSDAAGRTHRFRPGGKTEPLWLQARTPYETAAAAGLTALSAIQNYTWAVVEPNLNLYLTACYPGATTPFAPTTLHVYDAATGVYFGTWTIGTETLSIGGNLLDANNQPATILLGTLAGVNGEVWKLNRIAENIWQDNLGTVSITAQTQRLGFNDDIEWLFQRVTAITGTSQAVTISTLTPNASTGGNTITPAASVDGTYRCYFPLAPEVGRGLQVTLSPSTTTMQWQLFRVSVRATPQNAQPGTK